MLRAMATSPSLLALLRRQGGLITCRQAEEHGLPARTLRQRAEDDGWSQVAPRVYLAGGHRFTERARVRAAGLWAGHDAAVSGPAAAWWHGMLERAPQKIGVTVPRRRGKRAWPGVRVRRRDLHPADRVRVDELTVTGRALTALETAIAVPDGSAFLDRALQKHVPFAQVYGAYCRNMGARGGAGIAALLTAAADRAPTPRRSASCCGSCAKRASAGGGWACRSRAGCSTSPSPTPASPSRSTAGPGTRTSSGSATTGARAMPSSTAAGSSCGSPGTTSRTAPATSSPRSARPSWPPPRARDHRACAQPATSRRTRTHPTITATPPPTTTPRSPHRRTTRDITPHTHPPDDHRPGAVQLRPTAPGPHDHPVDRVPAALATQEHRSVPRRPRAPGRPRHLSGGSRSAPRTPPAPAPRAPTA